MQHAYESGIPFNAPEEYIDTPELRQFLRTAAADTIVLLKNDKRVLPLSDKVKSIAVIGPNAKARVISGGGSAALKPSYVVTPYEGIVANAPEGVEVHYSVGCYGKYDCSPRARSMLK